MIAGRFHFHWRVQAVDESVAEFDAALRNLATYCKFKGTGEEALRNRFVCGERNEATQRKLLTEHDLTYQKALEIAKSMKAVERNSILLKTRGRQLIRFFIERRLEQREKHVTAVVKQAITQINAVTKRTLSCLRQDRAHCYNVQFRTQGEVFPDAVTQKPSRKKPKMNRFYNDRGTTETESTSEEDTVRNV